MYEYMYVWMLVRITVKQKATTKNSQKTVMIHTEMKKAIEAEQKMLEEKHPGQTKGGYFARIRLKTATVFPVKIAAKKLLEGPLLRHCHACVQDSRGYLPGY